MTSIAERLRKSMMLRNLKQVDIIKKTGINKGALSSYLSGKYAPKQNNIHLLAKALDVNEAWLMGHDVPMERNSIEEIPEEPVSTDAFFHLKVKGDSMIPNICDGDTVIVRRQDDAESGDIVIVTVCNDEATCKRLRKYRDGIELIANNPSCRPMEFSNQDVIEKPVQILGKVVELRRKI